MTRSLSISVAWLGLLLFCGCGDLDLEQADPASIPERPTYGEEIGPMMNYYCAPCHSPHAQLGPNLKGYDFSSYAGVVAGISGIEKTVFRQGRMPPGAARRLTAREQALLRAWQAAGYLP